MSDRLDWLAGEVLEVLESEIGASYAAEKRERLLGLNRFEVLLWCNNLDAQNIEALATRLKIDPAAFNVTIQTLRSL
jgi:hypothetical protein